MYLLQPLLLIGFGVFGSMALIWAKYKNKKTARYHGILLQLSTVSLLVVIALTHIGLSDPMAMTHPASHMMEHPCCSPQLEATTLVAVIRPSTLVTGVSYAPPPRHRVTYVTIRPDNKSPPKIA